MVAQEIALCYGVLEKPQRRKIQLKPRRSALDVASRPRRETCAQRSLLWFSISAYNCVTIYKVQVGKQTLVGPTVCLPSTEPTYSQQRASDGRMRGVLVSSFCSTAPVCSSLFGQGPRASWARSKRATGIRFEPPRSCTCAIRMSGSINPASTRIDGGFNREDFLGANRKAVETPVSQ